MFRIHSFQPQARCEMSGRTGEAIEISADDGSLRYAVFSLPEFAKLLRFRYLQQQKQNEGHGSDDQTTPRK